MGRRRVSKASGTNKEYCLERRGLKGEHIRERGSRLSESMLRVASSGGEGRW